MPRETAGNGHIRGIVSVQAPVASGTGAEEYLTDYAGAFKYVVEKVSAVVKVAGTGAGATRTFRVIKNASTVVASATIALAATATKGAVIDLPVTAADATFFDGDTLTVDVSSGGTSFTALTLEVMIQTRTKPQQLA